MTRLSTRVTHSWFRTKSLSTSNGLTCSFTMHWSGWAIQGLTLECIAWMFSTRLQRIMLRAFSTSPRRFIESATKSTGRLKLNALSMPLLSSQVFRTWVIWLLRRAMRLRAPSKLQKQQLLRVRLLAEMKGTQSKEICQWQLRSSTTVSIWMLQSQSKRSVCLKSRACYLTINSCILSTWMFSFKLTKKSSKLS